MSLENLGDILECSRQNISKIEHGKIKTLPAKKIPTIAKKLGVSPAYLLGLADQEYMPTRIECMYWENPSLLMAGDNEKDPYKPFEESKQIISYVKFYLGINPDDAYRFYETDFEQAQERVKTIISNINDIELLCSLEKILNSNGLRYNEIVSIIKAIAALCTIPDAISRFFSLQLIRR